VRFTRIELRNWKNFTKVEAELDSRVFVIGPNASGKSNFLEVFKFLRDLALPGGGLAEACRVRGGVKNLRSVFARRSPQVEINAELVLADRVKWGYSLTFTKDGRDGPPRVIQETVWNRADGDSNGRLNIVLDRPTKEDKADPERLSQTALEQTVANRSFREVAEFFRTIRYLHLVPQVVREGASKPDSIISEDSMGRDLLDRIHGTPKRTKESRLKLLVGALRIAVPQFESLEVITDERGRPHLRCRFQHWRPNGAFQDETQLSDGTLRLIGLLWSLMDGDGPLLLEEPELSLHTGLLHNLAPLIHRAQKLAKGRQVILSTHSEHLLRDEGIGPEEILFIEPNKEGSRLVEAKSNPEIVTLMARAGLSASEAVLPRTSVHDAGNLGLVFK
jgi:predicted ATPase